MIILTIATGKIIFKGRQLGLALRIAHLYQSNGYLVFWQSSLFQEEIPCSKKQS